MWRDFYPIMRWPPRVNTLVCGKAMAGALGPGHIFVVASGQYHNAVVDQSSSFVLSVVRPNRSGFRLPGTLILDVTLSRQ